MAKSKEQKILEEDLTKQQIDFCNYYIALDFNGAAAAEKAKYSKKSARQQASRLLTNVNIQRYIAFLVQKASEKLKSEEEAVEISQEKVIREIGHLAFSNLKDFLDEKGQRVPLHLLPRNVAASVSEVEIDKKTGFSYPTKIHRKPVSLELLGRHTGVFQSDDADIHIYHYEHNKKDRKDRITELLIKRGKRK